MCAVPWRHCPPQDYGALDRIVVCRDDELGIAGFTDAGERILQSRHACDAR